MFTTAKAGTCAPDKRALPQLALNVHFKHSEQTCTAVRLMHKQKKTHTKYGVKTGTVFMFNNEPSASNIILQ